MKILFTNIQKQQNVLKITYFLRNLQTREFLELKKRNFQGIVFI